MENKKYAIAALAGLVLVVGGLALWSAQKTAVPEDEVAVQEQNDLVASDARPSDVVSVDSVTLAHGGFVVIHEDAQGVPGAILGASAYLAAGMKTGVPVKLSRMTRDGELLYAMLHRDDGDQKFDPQYDLPVISGDPAIPVIMRFHSDSKAPGPGEQKL
ncbi:MAG: hypothetical protein V4674_00740 [Patescibacteria group bacterium]